MTPTRMRLAVAAALAAPALLLSGCIPITLACAPACNIP